MRKLVAVSIALLAVLLPLAVLQGPRSVERALAIEEEGVGDLFVARVYVGDDVAALRELARYDIWERNREAGYVAIAMDRALFDYLAQLGYRLEVDLELTVQLNQVNTPLPDQISGIPGYPCYRTVEETYATAEAIAAAHPTLATWSDVGDSWQKTVNQGGYDLYVLRLTNAGVPGPKPQLFITAAVHAREYTTAELTTRFAEYLVDNYGLDADATWLLDYHEIHLLLHANPDGRKRAEAGASWRKNTNSNYCSIFSSNHGADLNRNFDFQWGCCGGSSGSQCDLTYRGPSAASEPEVQAIQNYMRAQFPDQRAAPLDAAAPADATGVYLDIHSYSELVLWPWGFTSAAAPNGPALQTLGRKLAYFNGYEPDQSIGLYPTDGTTVDFAYGDLGVAAYTFELGTAFFESCSLFEETILPDNLPALLYAAKVARAPYLTPAGPEALDAAVAPASVGGGGDAVTLTAVLDDTRFNNQNGVEPAQPIVAAAYYVNVPPWATAENPVALPMTAVDGAFDSPVESVTATVDASGLAAGRHILYVRGQDAAGNWGPVSAVFLEVTCAAPAAVTDAAITAVGLDGVELTWSPASGASQYQVWSAVNDPFFAPASGADCAAAANCALQSGTTYTQAGARGAAAQNYTFVVQAVSACGGVSGVSNRVGEFDYALTPGAQGP